MIESLKELLYDLMEESWFFVLCTAVMFTIIYFTARFFLGAPPIHPC